VETVALVVEVAVEAVTLATDGLTTLPDMAELTPVEVAVVALDTETWTNTLSTAEVTSQETVVPEARVL
jgi:hypothetical protein